MSEKRRGITNLVIALIVVLVVAGSLVTYFFASREANAVGDERISIVELDAARDALLKMHTAHGNFDWILNGKNALRDAMSPEKYSEFIEISPNPLRDPNVIVINKNEHGATLAHTGTKEIYNLY